MFSECKMDGLATSSLEDSGDGSELANSVPPGLQRYAVDIHFQPEGPDKKTTKTIDGFGLKKNRTPTGRHSGGGTLDMNSWTSQLKELEYALVA